MGGAEFTEVLGLKERVVVIATPLCALCADMEPFAVKNTGSGLTACFYHKVPRGRRRVHGDLGALTPAVQATKHASEPRQAARPTPTKLRKGR